MSEMIAVVHKGAEKIPVQITGRDDPRLQALCDTHGAEAVHIDGVSMAQPAPESALESAPEPVAPAAPEKNAAVKKAPPAPKKKR